MVELALVQLENYKPPGCPDVVAERAATLEPANAQGSPGIWKGPAGHDPHLQEAAHELELAKELSTGKPRRCDRRLRTPTTARTNQEAKRESQAFLSPER